MHDRFALWFIRSWILGLILRMVNPVFLWSQLRFADMVGVPVRWYHLTGEVSINSVDPRDKEQDVEHPHA
jgi:hypothetical protein